MHVTVELAGSVFQVPQRFLAAGPKVMVMSPAASSESHGDLDSGLDEGHEHGVSDFTELPGPPPRGILDAAGELLRVLAAPVRIAFVWQLRESQRCVHELVDALNVPQPLVSQPLKILKAAGVVTGARSGREVLYTLADHHLSHIVIDAVAHAGEDKP